MANKQYLLMILDGIGINEDGSANAFYKAKKPNIDRLFREYPNSRIKTNGEAVGLPEGQMGNSEVGHTNIGSGRVIYQELSRITKAIKDGDFFDNPALVEAMDKAKNSDKALHLIGLVSGGGVHSHQDHLYALLELAKKKGLDKVYVHAILDGRDTPPRSGKGYLEQLEAKIREIGIGEIATISGRYYTMDRDQRWDRTKLAYDAMTMGAGDKFNSSIEAIDKSYENDISDEFVKPCLIANDSKIENGDSILIFNFRPDRARQISRALSDPSFDGFDREVKLQGSMIVTMTEYDKTLENVVVAFKPQDIKNTLGEILSDRNYSQLRIAETEKYAHVTFFFNGGKEEAYRNEDRELIPSPKEVATYDLKPEMSACKVTEKIIESIENKKHDVIITNYANGDMVGHTGNIEAAIKAVEALDECVGRVIEALEKAGGEAIITADHGNCECMKDPETGEVMTSHTTLDVPIITVSKRVESVKPGSLCDIAPTLLDMMNEEKPEEMTGESLVQFK